MDSQLSTLWLSTLWLSTLWLSTLWLSTLWLFALGSSMSQRRRILDKQDVKIVQVHVIEWDESVQVKSWTGLERKEYEDWCKEGTMPAFPGQPAQEQDSLDVMTKAVILAVMDETGKPLFERSDLQALKSKNAAAMLRLFVEIGKLNGISDADVAELRAESQKRILSSGCKMDSQLSTLWL